MCASERKMLSGRFQKGNTMLRTFGMLALMLSATSLVGTTSVNAQDWWGSRSWVTPAPRYGFGLGLGLVPAYGSPPSCPGGNCSINRNPVARGTNYPTTSFQGSSCPNGTCGRSGVGCSNGSCGQGNCANGTCGVQNSRGSSSTLRNRSYPSANGSSPFYSSNKSYPQLFQDPVAKPTRHSPFYQ